MFKKHPFERQMLFDTLLQTVCYVYVCWRTGQRKTHATGILEKNHTPRSYTCFTGGGDR